MKKTILYFLLSLCCNTTIFAQFHDNTTILGYQGATLNYKAEYDTLDNCIITYPEGSPIIQQKKYLGIEEIRFCNIPYSDPKGNFKFFSNGVNVWNSKFKIMANGEEFSTSNWTNDWQQYNIALPFPNTKDSAMLFYSEVVLQEFPIIIDTISCYSEGFYASVIDLSPKQGLGAMLDAKNIISKKDSLTFGAFVATKHANGRDWWILVRKAFKSNQYFRLLLTNKGVKNLGIQKIGKPIINDLAHACFSPNGLSYAVFDTWSLLYPGTVNIYDFDRCTGLLDNHVQFEMPIGEYGGVAISPNSRYLYVSLREKLLQFDLLASDIEKSKIIVGEYDGFKAPFSTYFYSLQLMPDGRIYCAARGGASIYHVIQKPDLGGLDCRFEQHAIHLPCHNSSSVPWFPNYRLGPIDGSSCDSLGIDNMPQAWYRYEKDTSNLLKVEFTDLSFYEPNKWSWDFGDNSPLSAERHNTHIFPKKGTYKVCLTVSNNNGTNTHCKNINLGNTTSIKEEENQYDIVTTPNPFSEKIFVTSNEVFASPKIHFINTQGQEVLKQKIFYGVTEISTSHFSTGLYAWFVESNGRVLKTGKMIKI